VGLRALEQGLLDRRQLAVGHRGLPAKPSVS
jgi:hypothetical protein